MNSAAGSLRAKTQRPRHPGWSGQLLAILGVAVLGLFAAAYTPLPNALSRRFAAPARVEPADAIVVLAGGIQPDGTLYEGSLRRLLYGVALHRRGLAPLLVLSGSASETGSRVALLRQLGLMPDAGLLDVYGRDTQEEAHGAATLLMGREVRRLLLVSDAQHLVRARRLFERAGFIVLPAHANGLSHQVRAPEDRLALLRLVMRELAGRLAYRLTGAW